MSVVKRGWFVAAPGKGGRMDYLSLCFVCGALVLDASEDGQSTWRRHMDWHSPEERKTVHDGSERRSVMTHDQQMDTPENLQIEHINLIHDPLCPGWFDTLNGQAECDACQLIAKVRQDEQAKAEIQQAQPSWKFPFTATVTVRQPMTNYREHL